jgi:hypothetical protein
VSRPGATRIRRHVRTANTVALLVLVVAAAACGSTAGERTAYRQSAVGVLDAALGEARTAELAGRLWLEGSSTWAVTHVAVGESDTSIGSDVDWFAGQQPPTRADDELRGAALDALDAAAAGVEDVRIRVERFDETATAQALTELRAATAGLERLSEAWR